MSGRLYRLLLMLVVCIMTGQPTFAGSGESIDTVIYVRSGRASYYAEKFQGRHTSNGERLDNEAYTCAHPRLPYGTYVRVTNLKNLLSVVVRVTDRFKPRGDHLIDLTRRAAGDIDLLRHGMARVRVEVLEPGFARQLMPKDTISLAMGVPCRLPVIPTCKPSGTIQLDSLTVH